jgi:pimeloyl-ACP methyl ester carboxylesterase
VTEAKTYTLEVPGAVLAYDIRNNDSTTEPPLLLIGSPMGAAGFGTLAKYFTDRTVVTYDPRGAERSKKSDPDSESTPDQHADDIHRIIAALDKGPVDVFASSGGAVNALALVAKHPEDVRTLVAHEPPAAQVLPDREHVLAANRDIRATYERSGVGPAMAKFIALVMQRGPIGPDYKDRPAPDPAAFGLPTTDDGSRSDPLMANMISCTHYEHDFDALRAAPTRIVIAAGEESQGEMANRGAYAVAERLGTTPVVFPSNHGGFLGGEYGQMAGKPEAFAATLRQVLDADYSAALKSPLASVKQ